MMCASPNFNISAVTPITVQNRVSTHPAIQYLNSLFDKNDVVCITFIHGTKKYPNGRDIVENEFRLLSEVVTDTYINRMQERNKLWQIYVSMAPFKPGLTRRLRPNTTEVRHVWAEADKEGDKSLAELRAAVNEGLIPAPTFIAQSSPHKFHFIWNVVEFTLLQQEALNRTLAQKFGADTRVFDGARVLRIPGFRNIKAMYLEPKPIAEIIEYNTPPSQGITIHDFKIPMLSEQPDVALKPAPPRTEDPLAADVDTIPDPELIRRIRASKQGEKFSELMGGQCPDGYFAASNSLCAILSWWTRANPDRIDRIYKTSRLYTDPPTDGGPNGSEWWAEPVEVGLTRGEKTIARSCARAAAKEMYDSRINSNHDDQQPFVSDNQPPFVDAEPDSDSTEPKLFRFSQTPAKLSDKPIEWVIEGMFPSHGISIVCGREGVGKGVNALLSLAAMLRGGVFLGRKANVVPHVLYVDMENPEAVVRERLAKIGLLDAPNLRVWGQWALTPPALNLSHPMYMEYAQKVGGFIFFDSLIDFSNGKDENDAAAMNEILSPARLLSRHCAGVHFQHHSDKYGKSGWRGSTAITAAVDMAFGVRAEDDEAFRKGTNREVCFSTLKPKMCAPYHIKYEIVGWDGQLAYRIISDRNAAPRGRNYFTFGSATSHHKLCELNPLECGGPATFWRKIENPRHGPAARLS